MKIATLIALTVMPLVSVAQSKPFVGTYEVFIVEKGKVVSNKTLPPGQVMVLSLKKDGKLLMANMMSGFEGTWTAKGKSLTMTFDSGPAGKLKKPEEISLRASPDRSRIIVTGPKTYAGHMEFHWNPTIQAEVNARMQDKLKNLKPSGKAKSGN